MYSPICSLSLTFARPFTFLLTQLFAMLLNLLMTQHCIKDVDCGLLPILLSCVLDLLSPEQSQKHLNTPKSP